MIYLDTNVLVSLLIEDVLSRRAVAWLESQDQPLAFSEWGRAEFNAVAGVRKRKGELAASVAKIAIAALENHAENNYIMLPVSDEIAALAATWLRNPDCSLQTGDALHLAIASNGRATAIATFDERFAKAAARLRLANMKILLIPDATPKAEQKRATYRVTAKKKAAKVGTNLQKKKLSS